MVSLDSIEKPGIAVTDCSQCVRMIHHRLRNLRYLLGLMRVQPFVDGLACSVQGKLHRDEFGGGF